jgi:peptide deformylase
MAHEDPVPPIEVEPEQPEDRYARLDPETRARRDAALRLVRKYGDPVLKSRALPVERFDDGLREEIRRMGDLMNDALGIGLAATQLGVMQNVLVDVDRPIHVRVRAQDETGEEILIEASGLEARVLQHEMDHLDGVLILDRTSRDQRKQAMRTLREGAESDSLRVA